MFLQNFTLAWLQLTYAIAFFLLLAARAWNIISLDAIFLGEQSGGRAGAKAARVLAIGNCRIYE